ncbi:lytic polysaccharide monooxygenase [Stackebrandtia soli]|uniref:lytic polysaccharide monooxygenase n=1 Tax=Stackebrandtia soli TaxID=1892856 RepID=UPI0039EB3074
MSITRIRRIVVGAVAAALATAAVTVVTSSPASAHGYTTSPVSRAYHCKQGTATNCGPIQWEPQSVEGPKGFPSAGPADGKLCSAGLGAFDQLNDPRGGSWPKTNVSAGSYTFDWTLTAAHATTDFRYYITKSGWNSNHALTRGDLDLTPFLTVPMGGVRPPYQVSHTGNLPQRSGHHVILAVWTISDTGNAFYQCSDVNF